MHQASMLFAWDLRKDYQNEMALQEVSEKSISPTYAVIGWR
jgi:hypothetical protein